MQPLNKGQVGTPREARLSEQRGSGDGKSGRGHRIAVIDDDESLNRSLVLHLEQRGFQTSSYVSGREALGALVGDPVDVALLDVRLKDIDGIEVLRRLRQECPTTSVVMITAFHETDVTVKATTIGAFDYLPKPLSLDQLDNVLDRALSRTTELRRTDFDVDQSSEADEPRVSFSNTDQRRRLVGTSPPMLELFKAIGTVAASEASVLLFGESGTGKELVARTIHEHSSRSGLFLSVNCAMLSAEFLASELFGHEKGAFTGAVARRKGIFELADGGTLLLDEVSEMDVSVQARLLRTLQEREFQRLGSNTTLRTDVRVIAATNQDLEEAVASGEFRRDLYFRLAVVPMRLPPLRERREDVPLLVQHILRTKTRARGGGSYQISPEALALLVAHEWPGNVRELENVIIHASLTAQGSSILASDIGLSPGQPELASEVAVELSLDEVFARHIARVLKHTRGNKVQAARILGISRPTLDSKMKRFGLRIDRLLREE